jgi:peptide chain release factor 2
LTVLIYFIILSKELNFTLKRSFVLQEIDSKELLKELNELKEKIDELYRSVGIDELKRRLSELELQMQRDEIWKEQAKFTEFNQEISKLKKKIEPWNCLISDINESIELVQMAASEGEQGILREVNDNIKKYKDIFEELETRELLSGEADISDAIVTIHPGAGGTESQDWASMLLRMYTRWAEKNGFETELIDYMPGEEAGIKNATILIKGEYAYGLLKGEMGVHRLVRISPFDANKRRHTSFASVEILPDVNEDIQVDINENDLKIDTYRASGAGGQHVNRTDSAVRITHLPTGIVVQCQNERSQHKNKAFAMKVLKAKLYELYKKESDEKKMEAMGEKKDISWGNQIRSYVFQPYTLVKDHRTGEEIGTIEYVMDGEINRFLYAYLKSQRLSG